MSTYYFIFVAKMLQNSIHFYGITEYFASYECTIYILPRAYDIISIVMAGTVANRWEL